MPSAMAQPRPAALRPGAGVGAAPVRPSPLLGVYFRAGCAGGTPGARRAGGGGLRRREGRRAEPARLEPPSCSAEDAEATRCTLV